MPRKRNDKSKIGTILYLNRTAAGLTQEQLAEKIRKTKCMVSKYENGHVCPPMHTIVEMARACGVAPGTFAKQIAEMLEEDEDDN